MWDERKRREDEGGKFGKWGKPGSSKDRRGRKHNGMKDKLSEKEDLR